MKREWYLGLDIGSASVGFAATDTQYNILTKSGKLQCGARLFKEAQDASTRRGFRSSRRRFARRKVRIDLLQSLFNSHIAEKDASFFIRLNESNRHDEDKTVSWKYPLFNDPNFTDRDYYKNFPTIYHLRKHLLENEVDDVRLLYLACHHLIKYRGHFLFSRFDTGRDNSGYSEILAFFGVTSIESLSENKSIAGALKSNKIDLAKTLAHYFDDDKDALNEFKESLAEIKDELKEYKFSSEQFEECHGKASEILNESQIEYILMLKNLYDRIRLDGILGKHKTIADAMVARYDEHKADLELLKAFIKEHLPSEYDSIFRENGVYSNYVGSNMTHKTKTISHCAVCKMPITTITHDEFLAAIAKIIDKASVQEGYAELKAKIDNKTLCKIHNTQDNSIYPHQLQEMELFAILQKQSHFDLDIDKIRKLLTFRIPYYVGVLSEKHSDRFAWIVKNEGFEGRRVLPWNFDEVVDTASSGERFITRMTSKCTYLRSEDVIPKQSLLYQKYMLLNDLNNLKINGNRISQELKLFLLGGICQTEMSLTKAKIKKFLIDHSKIAKSDTVGKENENDTAFNSSLSSLIRFRDILGDSFDLQMCEKIIMWHTVFGDEKELVEQRIKEEYGTQLSDETIEKLSKLTFNGWGRFSEKFLNGITTTDKTTGEPALTIMWLLENAVTKNNTAPNLNEILNSDSYTPKFVDTVVLENPCGDVTLDYDGLVADLYCSPIVKRSIWQAILICKELTKINGCPPTKVFIEVTRGEDKNKSGKKTSSRRKQIEELLNKAVETGQDLTQLMSDFNSKTDEREFRSDRLYLYFTQLGKCMYCGKSIDVNALPYKNYDIDHIYPQSKIKDDSLTNRVLVCRNCNINKKNIYPIVDSVRSKMDSFWKCLLAKKLINSKKHDRLKATQPLTDEQINGFINRQLVSTAQAAKETKAALEILFPIYSSKNAIAQKMKVDIVTKVEFCKARNVSDFRNMFDLIKCREVNNLHHAHDAYLNIVVGNEWNVKYTNKCFSAVHTGDEKLLVRLFPNDWTEKHLEKIRTYLFDNKKYLDKFPVTTRPYEAKGAFCKKNALSKGNGQCEIKEGLAISQYGGYANADGNEGGSTAFNCVIEHDETFTNRIRNIFPVHKKYALKYKRYSGEFDWDGLLIEIAKNNNLLNPIWIVKKITMFSVLEIDGIRYHMRSGANNLQCSVTAEWYPDKNVIRIVRNIAKYKREVKKGRITKEESEEYSKLMIDVDFATRERNKNSKESKTITREGNLTLYDAIIEQVKKPFYANYSFAKKVAEGRISRGKFEELTTIEQAEQLISLLNLITMNGTLCNAKKIGGVDNETCKFLSNNVFVSDVYLITQSVTGLVENRIAINTTNTEE
ncbi:MAG: type II CRISPR RNA-guided endonuclease Cas9 [Oscillospiraceae bacterium]|nr:type II CRISPR RNA-guided endonuclease Cas9 [Oscillospiraceae bacterium]